MHIPKTFQPRIVCYKTVYDYAFNYYVGYHTPTNQHTEYHYYDNVVELIKYNGSHFLVWRNGYTIETVYGDPVPALPIKPRRRVRTHKLYGSKHNHRSSFRHPQTFQEKKAYYDPDIAEYRIKIRGTRQAKHLPDVYWEMILQHNDQRSWKSYRKSQYKSKIHK